MLRCKTDQEYWTTKDAARHLGVGERTIYGWVSLREKTDKRPPHVRFGRMIRFPITKFKDWVRQREQD